MGFGQVLTIGAFAFIQIRHRIQPEAIYPHIAPEIDEVEDFLLYQRVVVVEIGLVMKKSDASNIVPLRGPSSSCWLQNPGK